MKAQAALQSGQDAALRSVFAALTEAQSKNPRLGVRVGTLQVRLEAKLAPTPALLERAKRLSHQAPGDPEALLALAEAALAVHDAETASTALTQRFVVAPDDAAAYYLLGRARRLAVDAAGAEAAFRKALALCPGQLDSLVGLAGLLLDIGKYADADALYQQLAARGVSLLQGRLGRVEALLGLGRIDDAQVQVDAVPESGRSSLGYRTLAARVALANKKVGQALSLLRPLVDVPNKSVMVLSLYGDALFAAEEIDAAAGAYDSALALDAELPEALIGRADVFLRAERPKDALETLQNAQKTWGTRLRPPDLRARMLGVLGHAYIMRSRHGDMETARTELREGAQLAGAPAEVFFWLGESLGGKITPDAQAAYQRYLRLDPSGKYADRARRALGPLLQ
jgi:tetratricopeptide (TPR) repeat protein